MTKFKSTVLILGLLGFGILTAVTGNGAATGSTQSSFVADELIVKYKPGADPDAIAGKHNGKVDKQIGKLRVAKVKIPKGKDPKSEALAYENDPTVEYAEPNYLLNVDFTPNDPSYNSQWSIPKMKVDQAWNTTTGNNTITVAVVDTGVDSDHPDLLPNLVGGYNTITNTTTTNDDNGHGTHVAGIAAGKMGNGIGISGISGNSKIMPIKAMSSNGSGSTTDISEGIVWAVDHGAKVINLSLGTPSYTSTMQSAVDYAFNNGAIVIAASGNDNWSTPQYPAAMNNVIAVGATNPDNTRASFSNYGSHLDLAAPGVNIYSTLPNTPVYLSNGVLNYGTMSGTSMATPNVAGVAALVWSYRPNLTPKQLENVLLSSATDIGAAGFDNYFGYGLVDALAALTQPVDTSNINLALLGDTPDPFSPTGVNTAQIKFTMGANANVTLKIYNSNNTLVKTVLNAAARASGPQSVTWNGKDDLGILVPSGVYTYTLQAEGGGNTSAILSDTITIDRTNPIISNIVVDPTSFAPTGVNSMNIAYDLSEAGKVTAGIYNKTNTLIKTLATNVIAASGTNVLTWDGKNNSGLIVNDDTYILKIDAVDNVNLKAVQKTQNVIIEAKNPVISAVSDSPDLLKVTGTSTSVINYTLSESALVTVKVYDSGNTLVKTLINGVSQTAGAKNTSWNGKDELGSLVADGVYTYKIDAVDGAGKSAVQISGTITTDKTAPVVSGLTVSPSLFVPTGLNTTNIAYTLSEKSYLTVSIYNSANTLVKTAVNNVLKNAGADSITWDGRGSTNLMVPDGVYTIKVTAKDLVGFTSLIASNTITIEASIPVISAVSASPNPLKATGTTTSTIYYTLSEPATVNIKVYDSGNNLIKTLVDGVSQTVGGKNTTWNGKDEIGNLVADGVYTYKINAVDNAGKSALQVTGTITIDKTAPVVSGFSASLNPFTPTGSNTTTLSYNLSEKAYVTIYIYNSANSLVRTVQAKTLKNAGANSVTWDGKNSSGIILGAGTYTVKMNLADTLGNSAIQNVGSITIP